jgi:hypothetical protein
LIGGIFWWNYSFGQNRFQWWTAVRMRLVS